jgi:hypothetical protein
VLWDQIEMKKKKIKNKKNNHGKKSLARAPENK